MIPNNNHMSGANSVGSQRSRGSRSTITSATGVHTGGHATNSAGACQACGVNVTTAFHQVETARRKLELLQEKIQVDQELLRSDKKNFKRRMQAARAAARAAQAELESRLHSTQTAMAGSGESSQNNSSSITKQPGSSSSLDKRNAADTTTPSSRVAYGIAQRRDQDWRQVTELRERLQKQELAHTKELQVLKDRIAILQKSANNNNNNNNNSSSSSVPNSPTPNRCTSPTPLSPPSSPPFLHHHPLRPMGASSSPGNKPKSLSPLTSRTAGETVGGGASTAGSTISTQRDSSPPTNRSSSANSGSGGGGRSAVHVIMDRDQRNHAAWLAQQQKHDEKIQLLQLKITTLTQKCDRLEKQLASCKLEQLEEKQRHDANRKEQEHNDQAQASQQRRVQQELKVALESSDKQRMELQRQIKELQEAATKTTNNTDDNNKAAASSSSSSSSSLEYQMLQGKLRECQLQVETLTKQLQQKNDELQLEVTKSRNDSIARSADLVKSQHQVEALTAQLEQTENELDATRMETEGYKATVDSQTLQIEQLELEKSDLELEVQTALQKVESLQVELQNVSSSAAAETAAAAKMAAEQLMLEQPDLTSPLAGEYIEHRTSSSAHQQPDPLTHRLVLEHEWHGTELTGVYTGWVDIDTGNPSGNGTLRVDDGAVYDGDWKNGHRHGQGVYATVEGDVYRGEWQDDLYHGTGTFVWSDGRVYRGMYSFGQRQGTGVMCWPYGAHYQGEYQNDKRNGLGQYVYADGRCYDGDYKEDRPHGYGTLKGANGTVIYDGHWELGEQLS
jgi:hypothetical protein